jgi:hypothetical protein
MSIAPPVPPIPDYVRKAALPPRITLDESVPVIHLSGVPYEPYSPIRAAPREGMTCLQFFSLHNHAQPISIRAH